MDLYKLFSPDDTNAHMPEAIVEGYTSLIWTERYVNAGEFQLKTARIQETLDLIPDGSKVCIDESPEIMWVESHAISVNDDGVEELTVSGRSFPTFLENRIFRADINLPYEMVIEYTVPEAIAGVILDKLCNNTTTDRTGGPNPHDPKEYVPGIQVQSDFFLQRDQSTEDPPDLTDLQSKTVWYLDNSKDAYGTVLEWLNIGDCGLRTIRPRNFNNTPYAWDPGHDGQIYQPSITPVPGNIGLELYNGRNLTLGLLDLDPGYQGALQPVIFTYDAGHIESPNYLITRKGYKNVCRVISTDGELLVSLAGGGSTADIGTFPSGLDRYEMQLDLGTLDAAIVDSNGYMRQKAVAALKANNRQLLIDGAIAANAPYQYGPTLDYYLGDTVTVLGNYGIRSDMRVSEYVRSKDQDGYKAYPTLIHLDPDV